MPPPVTLVSKLKVQLKMAIQRLRMLQQKQTAIAKQQRRTMAELLATNKLESARIRVENIIRSDISTELHEILELYCELLLARIGLLEGPVTVPALSDDANGAGEAQQQKDENALDSGLDEAVRSILYAAPKCDIKELSTARSLLVDKFGKDYASLVAEGRGVPERVVKRVRVETPKLELVDAYLREIGRTYGVRFPGDPDTEDEVDEEEDDDNGEDGGGGVAESVEDGAEPEQQDGGGKLHPPLPSTTQDLAKATPPRDMGESRSPLRIAPPSPTTENPKPSVKLPQGLAKSSKAAGAASSTAASSASTKKAAAASSTGATTSSTSTTTGKAKDKSAGGAGGSGPGGAIPNVDELAKRFAALKRG